MAVDKACWKVVAEGMDGRKIDRDGDADRRSHFWLEGLVEVDQPRNEEVTSRRLVFLRARCMPLFTMLSKGVTQDPLKCLTTPQAA